jgi:hypothetical protein
MAMSSRIACRARKVLTKVGVLLLFSASSVVVANGQTVVAGLQPDRRPEAPRIQVFEKSPQWERRAMAGVVKPFPPSLKFVTDQGGWYTPIIRPGMPGRYDIRRLHRN